jgi:hypothetical protein
MRLFVPNFLRRDRSFFCPFKKRFKKKKSSLLDKLIILLNRKLREYSIRITKIGAVRGGVIRFRPLLEEIIYKKKKRKAV